MVRRGVVAMLLAVAVAVSGLTVASADPAVAVTVAVPFDNVGDELVPSTVFDVARPAVREQVTPDVPRIAAPDLMPRSVLFEGKVLVVPGHR